jgi:uncharacterized protein
MTHQLPIPKDQIEEFCHRWKVAELSTPLSFAGTNSQERTGAIVSDLGFFVRFDPVAEWNLVDRIAMQEELQKLSGRNITLINRHRKSIRKGPNAMQLLYNA